MSNKKQQTFNRSDIELALSQEFPNLNKSQISLAIDSILESIVDAVALDEKVEIRGFGTFSKKYIRPRKFINPKTKEVSYLGETAIKVSTFTGSVLLSDCEVKSSAATATNPADALEVVSTLTGSIQIKGCTFIGTSTGTYLAEAIKADTACTVPLVELGLELEALAKSDELAMNRVSATAPQILEFLTP